MSPLLAHILKCFPEAVPLASPDWMLVLKIPKLDGSTVVCPLSRLDDLRSYAAASPPPLPARLVLLSDCHFGKSRFPKGEFHLLTPYGIFAVCGKSERPSGFREVSVTETNDCPECHFSVWPCERHLLPFRYET